MATPDLSDLTLRVLGAAFVLSVVFGAVSQRTHFCTMGAVSDAFIMGDFTRMRQWALAMGVAMIGFASLVHVQLLDPDQTLYASKRWIWLSALVGGLMFGFGMVLSSGCGSRTLVRIGSGSLKSVVVFVVMGVAAFATLKGLTAVLRVATVDRVAVEFATRADLPSWAGQALGLSSATAGLALALVFGGALMAWALLRPAFRNADNLLAGFGIGAIIVAMWWVSGHLGYLAEHPETLEQAFLATNSGRAEALSFVSPVAYTLDWVLFFSDQSKLLTVGIVSVAGVVVGSAMAALAARSFRWEGFGGPQDLAHHLIGAVLMGVGGVTAMGCTIGQGLSGLSTLSATSLVAVAAILAGALAALRYQVWRLERMA